jgi:hypothetical protein
MSLRIAFDCDGVVADLDSALADVAARLFGAAPRSDDEAPAAPSAATQPVSPCTAVAPGAAPADRGSAGPAARAIAAEHAAPEADMGPTPEEEQVEPPRYRTLTRPQQRRLWEAVRETGNFWQSLRETEPGIVARLAQEARERGWEVIFVTQRPASAGDITQLQTQRWLIAHGYDLPSVFVVKGTRGKVADALSLDVVVDDRPENCLDVKLESRARAILVWRGSPASLPPNAERLGIEVVPGLGACLELLTAPPPGKPGLLGTIRRLIGG